VSARRDVFVTGGTGYIGAALVPALVVRGHGVRVLARAGSESKVPAGAMTVVGDALDAATYRDAVSPADTFVHLVGTPHPAPWKGRQFRAIDLVSVEQAVDAAVHARVAHFIYLSVAQPAPIMKSYIAVRARGEALLRERGLARTILRPWYVLGPGHYWPFALAPVYGFLERLRLTREFALRLGLVGIDEMVAALVDAVEHPAEVERIVGVPEIARARMSRAPSVEHPPT
jgi:uncharacterized protein YbjT (DUF2867 family)